MVLLGISTKRLPRTKTNSSTPPTPRTDSPKMTDSSLMLKVTVLEGRDLAPKDKNGFSDPYLVVAWSDYRFQTEAQPKTLNPKWTDVFDMALSGASSLTMTCVCWDKDRFGKDYMGEFEVSLDELFNGNPTEESRWFTLKSSRKKAEISGEILLKFNLVDTAQEPSSPELIAQKWAQWLSSFVGATPSPMAGEGEDPLTRMTEDVELSDDDDDDSSSPSPDDESVSATTGKQRKKEKKEKSKKKGVGRSYEFNRSRDVVGVIFLEISSISDLPPEKNVTRTGFDMDPFVVVSLGKKTFRTKHIRHSLDPVYNEKMLFQVLRHEQNYSLSFTVIDKDKFSSNDFVAETTFPVQQLQATAPEADPETGLYYFSESQEDGSAPNSNTPSISGKSRFRLPLSRTSSGSNLALPNSKVRNPSDISRKSSSKSLHSLAVDVENSDEARNRAIPVRDNIEYNLESFSIPLPLKHKERWEDKHKPELYFKAKYVPYPALRQQFWRHMLKEYDSDDSGKISRVELTTMLDTLGSTLHESTISSFFDRFRDPNAEPLEEFELTVDQAVICLEDQLSQLSKKQDHQIMGINVPKVNIQAVKENMSDMKEAAKDAVGLNDDDVDSDCPTPTTEGRNHSQTSLQQPVIGTPGEEGKLLADRDLEFDNKSEEHVIQIKECPLCHQPRLNKRSEMDIVTHLATCASQDWRQVDKLVMGGFVTSSQAQRKWYSKVISKISYGGYKLGANSANILVQDRITGQIQEERMSVYVRLGIRLLYKGLASESMENKRIRKLLKSLSVKQGRKFDSPASARDIKPFIAFHQLDLSEVLHPLESFKTFNEFFYRELKPGSRPCTAPDNPKVIVSPADCRSVVFNRVSDATGIWIKGREFTIERLLGDAYPEDVHRFKDGALGIFRLAPQDYHRFHIPVDGVMGEPKLIAGEYYTVNPMAIRSALDVYGENVRICVPFDSVEHGRVMAICVGAMMVGSTVITREPGPCKRTDELGYFQFGGSTIVLLFEKDRMVFDEDLVDNSMGALETLIRVGMSIGHVPGMPMVEERKGQVSEEEKRDARRRIEGSMAPQAQ